MMSYCSFCCCCCAVAFEERGFHRAVYFFGSHVHQRVVVQHRLNDPIPQQRDIRVDAVFMWLGTLFAPRDQSFDVKSSVFFAVESTAAVVLAGVHAAFTVSGTYRALVDFAVVWLRRVAHASFDEFHAGFSQRVRLAAFPRGFAPACDVTWSTCWEGDLVVWQTDGVDTLR